MTKSKQHHDHAEHEDGHTHEHGGLLGKSTELIFAGLSGVFLVLGFGVSFINTLSPTMSTCLYATGYFFGGFYTTKEAYEALSKGKFEIDFLMLVAAVGAAFLGEWAEGALLLFLFSCGSILKWGRRLKTIG